MKDLDVFYGDAQALHGVSFSVGEEIVALVGGNGAGKTTTLKTISGVLKPRRGKILFEGREIQGMDPSEVVNLGLVQVPEGRKLFPEMTVQENLELGAYSKRARPHRRKTMGEVLELFPVLAERRGQFAGTLSGGEQQMVAVGRGLMAQPRLLMLDEPSLGLAPKIVLQILDVVKEIHARGVSVMLVEQNVQHSLALSHRAYVIENGEIVLDGPGPELLGDERVIQAYLGV